jgi:hypothetical protein
MIRGQPACLNVLCCVAACGTASEHDYPCVVQFSLELGRIVRQLSSHPCVVAFVVFNEGWGQVGLLHLSIHLTCIGPYYQPVIAA